MPLEIVIVASLEKQLEMDNHIKYCLPGLENNKDIVITYLQSALGSFFGEVELMNRFRGYFNYIEYYGPTGTPHSVLLEMNQLKSVSICNLCLFYMFCVSIT